MTETKKRPLTAKDVQEQIVATKARIDDLETWETEAILTELGNLVREYSVETVVVNDARPSSDDNPGYRFAYGISFQINKPGYTFYATAQPSSRTIREATIRAMQGALAMLGPEA